MDVSLQFGSFTGWNFALLVLLTKATIILIAALGITLAMQRASATARHLVWLVTLGTLVLVPVMTAWGPLKVAVLPAPSSIEPAAPTAANQGVPAPASTHVDQTGSTATGAPNAAALPTGSTTSVSAVGRLLDFITNMSGVTLVLAIWGTVVLGIIVMLAWAGLSVRQIVRRARPLESPDWLNPLFEIADRLGLEEAPRLLQSSDAKMPFACGLLKATIILPAESETWTLDRRRAVLLHELAHVRRHDLLGHTLGRLVCAVYWFHPLVWTAAKQLRSESERACDDLALACGTRATDYAEHLLDIVTSVRGDSTPLVALAMARRKEFEGRMLAILDPDLRHSTPSRKQSAALIATLALISLTVGAVAPVARSADAAVVKNDTPRVEAPAMPSALTDAPQSVPMVGKQYPDSGVRGENYVKRTSTSVSNSTNTVTSRSMVVSQSEPRVDARVDARADARAEAQAEALIDQRALRALESAGVNFGMSTANAVLSMLGDKGEKGSKSKQRDDERSALLAKVLKSDTSASLRRIAAWGLHEHSHTQVGAEALATAVRRDSDAKVREMAAWALGQGGDRGSVGIEALISALKGDANEKVRATAAWSLGNTGSRSVADALADALGDQSAGVRMRAAWALGNTDPRNAPKALIAMLSDKEPRVRELASWALYNIADPAAAPALDAALKVEENKEVQLAEIRALAALGERSVDALKSLLESKDQRVRQMAVRALAGGNASGPWPWPWPEPRPFP